MASARRISGSASASRFVRLQQLGEVVEVDAHVGMIGAEACLIDGERAAIERFGLGEPIRVLQQAPRDC